MFGLLIYSGDFFIDLFYKVFDLVGVFKFYCVFNILGRNCKMKIFGVDSRYFVFIGLYIERDLKEVVRCL